MTKEDVKSAYPDAIDFDVTVHNPMPSVVHLPDRTFHLFGLRQVDIDICPLRVTFEFDNDHLSGVAVSLTDTSKVRCLEILKDILIDKYGAPANQSIEPYAALNFDVIKIDWLTEDTRVHLDSNKSSGGRLDTSVSLTYTPRAKNAHRL